MRNYLRIAVTALSFTACVLLIALWMRSYWWADSITGHTSNARFVVVSSFWGRTALKVSPNPHRLDVGSDISHRSYEVGTCVAVPEEVTTLGFGAYWGTNGTEIRFPHWFLATMAGGFGVIPWIRRFSLRTLLIATTLVAVVLGSVIYVVK